MTYAPVSLYPVLDATMSAAEHAHGFHVIKTTFLRWSYPRQLLNALDQQAPLLIDQLTISTSSWVLIDDSSSSASFLSFAYVFRQRQWSNIHHDPPPEQSSGTNSSYFIVIDWFSLVLSSSVVYYSLTPRQLLNAFGQHMGQSCCFNGKHERKKQRAAVHTEFDELTDKQKSMPYHGTASTSTSGTLSTNTVSWLMWIWSN
jgi:hypothetical protein